MTTVDFLPDVCRLVDLKHFVRNAAAVGVARVATGAHPELLAEMDQEVPPLLAALRLDPTTLHWMPNALEFFALTYLIEQSAMRSRQPEDALIEVMLPMLTQLPEALLEHIEFDIGQGTFCWTDRVTMASGEDAQMPNADAPARHPGQPRRSAASGATQRREPQSRRLAN